MPFFNPGFEFDFHQKLRNEGWRSIVTNGYDTDQPSTREAGSMTRHIDNLERLLHRFQDCFGDDDEMVLQVKQEIEAERAKECHPHRWRVGAVYHYPSLRAGRCGASDGHPVGRAGRPA
ncbi:hypothetical protein [Rhodoferax lithotrophicus]|uniref:hypothetical protein n=1 Tax=Rhodoferax lithotrophicus TaxID=2798804 RepID=UPI001CC53A4C|nr:hypothetical protein [Rhodoferax sp. MIZ03]